MDNANQETINSFSNLSWPKVSVITVVRNDREGLRKTITSLAAQDYLNMEYIVIDGVSTDGTLDIIRQNESIISRWISEPDYGLYDAMNKGKSVATGDWILFLNAADTFPAPDALRRMLTPRPEPSTIVFGNVILSYGNLQWHRPPRKNGHAMLFKGYLPHHQTILYPRCFFRNNDYDLQFRVVADADYTRRAISAYSSEHRDVDLSASTLGGFTFTRYRSIKGAARMYRERLAYNKKHNPCFSKTHAARLLLLVAGKYLSVRIGGVSLATHIMYYKLKMGFGSFR